MAIDKKQTLEDILYMRKLLPLHYEVVESKILGSVRCTSDIGIMIDKKEDSEHWYYITKALKLHFGDRFQEIYHKVSAYHCDFTIYIKNK